MILVAKCGTPGCGKASVFLKDGASEGELQVLVKEMKLRFSERQVECMSCGGALVFFPGGVD